MGCGTGLEPTTGEMPWCGCCSGCIALLHSQSVPGLDQHEGSHCGQGLLWLHALCVSFGSLVAGLSGSSGSGHEWVRGEGGGFGGLGQLGAHGARAIRESGSLVPNLCVSAH